MEAKDLSFCGPTVNADHRAAEYQKALQIAKIRKKQETGQPYTGKAE